MPLLPDPPWIGDDGLRYKSYDCVLCGEQYKTEGDHYCSHVCDTCGEDYDEPGHTCTTLAATEAREAD